MLHENYKHMVLFELLLLLIIFIFALIPIALFIIFIAVIIFAITKASAKKKKQETSKSMKVNALDITTDNKVRGEEKRAKPRGITLLPDVTLKDIRNVLKYPSAVSLIATNFIILVCMLFFGWNWGLILILYWAESGVIGFYTILKMLYVKKVGNLRIGSGRSSRAMKETRSLGAAKAVTIPFFMLHFGGFMLGHFIFVILVAGIISALGNIGGEATAVEWLSDMFVGLLMLLFGLFSLFVSHGISFYTNYLKKKEYEHKTLGEVMFSPYRRIIIMHLSIFAISFLALPVFGVIGLVSLISTHLAWILLAIVSILFIAGKTFVDLASHAAERKRFGSL